MRGTTRLTGGARRALVAVATAALAAATVTATACEEEAPASAQRATPRAPSGLDRDPWAPIPEAEVTQRIAAARRDARASGRRVLLDFGAAWCRDCREVVRLARQEPARSVIEERYIVVFIDIGASFDRNRALIEEHRVRVITTLVVLDPASGAPIARTTLEPITGGQRGLTSEALAGWLRAPTSG